MVLDIVTLLLATLINALLMVAALSLCVGFSKSDALRLWTWSLTAQALGFGLLIASSYAAPRLLASLGILLLSAAVGLMQLCAARFTGATLRPLWLLAPAPLLGLAHWLVYEHTQATVALSNAVLGAQTLWAAWGLLRGAGRQRWRWLIGVVAAGNGLLIWSRCYLVLMHVESFPAFREPHPLNLAGMLFLHGSMVLGTMAFLLAHRDEAEQALQELASLDSLTGLPNRRVWLERAAALLARAGGKLAPGQHCWVMLLDLDHFKQINDSRGHPVGDQVLQLLGRVLKVALRRDDIAGRYGGEEFCLLLSDCSAADFAAFDARLHQQLSEWSRVELGFEVRFSAGAVAWVPGLGLMDAIRQADEALYRAKAAGRQRSEILMRPQL